MKVSFRPTRYNASFVRNEFAPTFFTCIAAFLILTGIFTVVACIKPEIFLDFVDSITSFFASFGDYETSGNGETFALLFSSNVQATSTAAVYGLVPFFYTSAFVLGINSFSLVSAGVYFLQGGNSLPAYLAGVLPHGIFEIPALLYACAIGICHCRLTTRAILRQEQPAPWRDQIVSLATVFVSVVVPLLLIAALVEAFITPTVMGFFI